jgi:flavorubredoxin
MVQANQHLLIDGGQAILIDPGGHKVYADLLAELSRHVSPSALKYIIFTHQDPDIIASTNGWLMVTDADAYISDLWMRFIPHFGVDEYVVKRIKPIPDEGLNLEINGKTIKLLPAHFLHSAGNFQVYDGEAKILYSGDLGASLGQDYYMVEDFDAHIPYMKGFHQRYLPSNKALKMWVNMVKNLEIEIIAPQHGAIFPNPTMVEKFIQWLDSLECGLDLMGEQFEVPQ